MKRFLHILTGMTTMAACLLFVTPSLAQDKAVQDSTAKKSTDHMERGIERMTERLDLTDEQAASVKAILAEHRQSLEELGERRRTLQDELKNSLGEVLTEEQMEKMGKRMSGDKNRKGKAMKGKRGGDRDRGKRMRGGRRGDGGRGDGHRR